MSDNNLGPYVDATLVDLVPRVKYKPNWTNYLQKFKDAEGNDLAWALYIISDTQNSITTGGRIRVRHEFLIPPANYNRDTWAAWLFDRYLDVEKHEAAEFFRIDNYREFAPHHGNGEDPYRVWHVSDHQTAAKKAGDE